MEKKLIYNVLFNTPFDYNKNIDNINFESFIKIASKQLLIPAIYANIRRKRLEEFFPNDLISYFKEIYKLNRERNEILLEEVKFLNNLLIKSDLKYVFIKGSSYILNNLFYDIGERMTGDIDILVEEKASLKVKQIIEKNGYYSKENNDFFLKEIKHYNRQINKNKTFAVEVHKKLYRNISVKTFHHDIFEKIFKINNCPSPDYKNQLLINIYNFQINDGGYKKCYNSIRSYYDIYNMKRKYHLKFDSLPKNKFIHNYFMLGSHISENIFSYNYDKDYHYLLRYKLKNKNILLFKIDQFVTLVLSKIDLFPRQLYEFLNNENYRNYIFKKTKKKLKFK